MSYWGYLSDSEVLPEFNLEEKELKFFARWNERDSRYEKYGANHLMANVITVIIEAMNRPGI